MKKDQESDGDEEKGGPAVGAVGDLDAADEEADWSPAAGQVVDHCVDEQKDRAIDGVDDDTDEQERDGIDAAAPARDGQDDRDGEDCAKECECLLADGGGGSDCCDGGGEDGQSPYICCQRRPAADAEQIGIGQWIRRTA